MPGRDPRVLDVVVLQDEGQHRYGRGDRAGAIEKYSAGCAIVRQMLATDVSDATNATQLGAMGRL